jgi:hypothetical protein
MGIDSEHGRAARSIQGHSSGVVPGAARSSRIIYSAPSVRASYVRPKSLTHRS